MLRHLIPSACQPLKTLESTPQGPQVIGRLLPPLSAARTDLMESTVHGDCADTICGIFSRTSSSHTICGLVEPPPDVGGHLLDLPRSAYRVV